MDSRLRSERFEPRGRRVTVMGLGRFGGGAGVAHWLAAGGARVLVTDLDPAARLGPALARIAPCVESGRVTLRLGGHDAADFAACDLVVVNPAVPRPWENPYLAAARGAGVEIATEIGLVVERLDRARVIGVTGTAGKSTTAAMIHHVLERCGEPALLGGNIGGSLLERLADLTPRHWIVLELSSAMLYWLDAGAGRDAQPGWSPGTAVLTNLAPNHLDWHGSVEHYRRCKEGIFRHQRAGDAAVRGPVCGPGSVALRVPGRHNQANARLAIAAAAAAGIEPGRAAAALADFPGLPHRLQLVAERGGLRFYNDSKSTTPEATRLAVESFGDAGSVHLLAGGYDKQIDLSAIVDLAREVAGLYTLGATGRSLAEAAAGRGHAQFCDTLEGAAEQALARMKRGDVLLLSPGCASWDQYVNYEERGEAFCRWVEARAERSGA
jgi:UDP-N-acetylmuramoylalanine--D-glutamate ligase